MILSIQITKIIIIKLLIGFAAAFLLTSFPVQAQEQSCYAAATEKKLAGAAKTAFLKKCEKTPRPSAKLLQQNANWRVPPKTAISINALKTQWAKLLELETVKDEALTGHR
jgi:hypothetical protein